MRIPARRAFGPRLALRSSAAALVIALAGAVASPSPASAAVVIRHDLATLVAKADLIATGRVVQAESQFRGGRIVTRYTLRCHEVVKGAPVEEALVEVLGGRVGNIGQQVAGMARFSVDEEVVVFLSQATTTDKPIYTVVGLSQGKLRVEPTLDGPMVVRDLGGLTTVQRAADGGVLEASPALVARQPLQAFVKDLVRLTAAADR